MFSPQRQNSTTHERNQGFMGGIINGCKSFCQQTSIHGFNHIAAPKRHWIERLLWLVVVATAVWGVVDISLGQWQRYRDNPTVVTLEKDFRTWHYTMPAVTACNQNRTNMAKLQNAIKTRWNVTPESHPAKYAYYSRFIDVVTSSDLYHLEGYEEFANDADLNVDLYELAVELMPEQRVKLSTTEQITTPPKWIPVMSEVGICYNVNSLAVSDLALVKLTVNDTMYLPTTCKYSPQGCLFIFENNDPIHYYVHSAYDIADIATTPFPAYPSLNSVSDLSTTETRAGPGVRDLQPRRRRCRYSDEPTAPDRQVHSTNLCRQDCKSRLALQLCGCKPFYYFYAEGPLCTPAGMRCMSGVSHRLATFDNIKCACVQQCIDSVFREVTTEIHRWDKGPLKLRGVVRLNVQAPRMRYTRYIVFHFQDLVVSFGGATGLYLGASFISFVEIVYFLIERVLCIGRKEKSKTLAKRQTDPYEQRIQKLTYIIEGHACVRNSSPRHPMDAHAWT